jgi:hypothetical protein
MWRLRLRVWKRYAYFQLRPEEKLAGGFVFFLARVRHYVQYRWFRPVDYYVCEYCGHAVRVSWAESHPIIDCPGVEAMSREVWERIERRRTQ